MRFALCVTLCICSSIALAQADLWKQVSTQQPDVQLGEAQISPVRLQAIHKFMRAHSSSIG